MHASPQSVVDGGDELALRFELEPLEVLQQAGALADVVLLRLPEGPHYLLRRPDDIAHVLVRRRDGYDKRTRPYLRTRAVFGDGLLTSDGEGWLRRRRIVQPALEPRATGAHLGVVRVCADELVERLRHALASGPLVDVGTELSRATSSMLTLALFDRARPELARRWCELVGQHLDPQVERSEAARRAAAECTASLRAELDEAIADAMERRAAGELGGGLLESLVGARARGGGEGLSGRELRDELATLLFAGSETTAVAVGWTLRLLAQHPAAAERVRDELAAVLGGRPPTVDDLPRLGYTAMVFDEALRLYPPAWSITRRAIADDRIGGAAIPAGAVVIASPWVTHRRPELWERPEAFDPLRFLPERAAARPRFAFFPFLGGPRRCVGAALANLEALVLLAAVVPRFHLEPFALSPGWPEPWVTLRPRGGLWLRVEGLDPGRRW